MRTLCGSGLGRWVTALAFLGVTTAGCNDRSRPTVPVFGNLTVLSDPSGAEIAVDGDVFEVTTPATLEGIAAGNRLLRLTYVPGVAETFLWADTVTVPEESVDTVDAALEGGCGRNCPFLIDQGRIRCYSTGRGDVCASVFFDNVAALQWPDTSGGAYGAGGRLLLAGIIEGGAQDGDTIAVQVYDVAWVGRSPMRQSSGGRSEVMELGYWGSGRYNGESLVGLEVKQTILAVDSADVEDVLFIHFELKNVSDDERYRRLYPWVPEGGYTYRSLYVGFGLDADIGLSEDDLASFDLDLDLAFVYDAVLQDDALGEFSERPALVGLVNVEAPAGATERRFTMWRRQDDWDDGDRHDFGWRILAGRLSGGDPIEDHPSEEVGYQGTQPDDYRITRTYGPLRITPGETLSLTVALVLAEPVAGTYTPGTLVPPGDPTSSSRQILDVAGDLRALAALVPELWDRYRP